MDRIEPRPTLRILEGKQYGRHMHEVDEGCSKGHHVGPQEFLSQFEETSVSHERIDVRYEKRWATVLDAGCSHLEGI